MFSIGDYIVYGSSGVCRITQISEFSFIDNQKSTYYVLSNVFSPNASTIYAPVNDGKIKMRKILSKNEVIDIIKSIPEMKEHYIDDDKLRKEDHRSIIRDGRPELLAALLKSLHHKKDERIKEGKKLPMSDEADMMTAQKVLYEEFALALEMRPEEVEGFIVANIN